MPRRLSPVSVRKGQGQGKVDREAFSRQFRAHYHDPAFEAEGDAIGRLEEIAWGAYQDGRKAPLKRPAGDAYADPTCELSIEWIETRAKIDQARERFEDRATASRVLVVIGSARNDDTCPGEESKSYRMTEVAKTTLEKAEIEVDVLDLSLLSSEVGKVIHPCKGCVSTAMPLCHFPCSCYPNHSLDQVNDWMGEIYERFTLAHGIIIVTPVYWYGAPGGLKVMIDRLVCADGGNPDPTSTQGKDPEKAKALELAGWGYPKPLAGRAFGLVVHGDAAGIEGVRRGLTDWLSAMGLVDSGPMSLLDRFIGYYESYAESHEVLDRDAPMIEEVRNVARAVSKAVTELRAGRLVPPDADLEDPRPK